MLIALGLPQLWDRGGVAGERMADEFCSLNLHGLAVSMGKAISDLRDISAQAGQAVLCLQNAPYLVHLTGRNTVRNPSEIFPMSLLH